MITKNKICFILILSFVSAFSLYGQEKDSTVTEEDIQSFKISPIAAPGYTPELGFLVAVGGLISFSTQPDNPDLLRSSFPITIAYTSTKAIVANGILTSFWLDDKLRMYGQFWYKDMPDNYWGIGYDAAFSTPKSDSTTAYQRTWWWINPSFLWQIKDNYFIGLNVDYEYTRGSQKKNQTAEEYEKGVASDPNYRKFNDKPLNSGLGIILQHDSRDIPVDTRNGWYLNLMASFYTEAFGGDNNYQMYLIDYRQAVQLSELSGLNTFAWQVKGRFTAGDVPYGGMSQLGTPFDLRGYTWGQYRDNNMFFFLAEYRHIFKKKDGDLGKHGMVAWVGSGTIFNWDTIKDNNNKWLPNFGVGYRFELQPRMWIRLDFGIGRNTSGIYFNFNQAF